MNYTPDPSFTSPDQVSRKTLLRVFLPLLMDPDLQPSNTPKIYPSMLTTTAPTTTTKTVDSTTMTSSALPITTEQTTPATSRTIQTTSQTI
ncbi:unnamed protein product, partial [Auanema sp. JU1783]